MLRYVHEVALPAARERGWHVHGHTVDASELGGNITYTVGLTEAGLPELAVTGLPHAVAAQILDDCAQVHLRLEMPVGSRYRTPGDALVLVVNGRGVTGPLARIMYGRRVQFRHLLWACPDGHFPGDPQWGDDHPRQPVYARPLPAGLLPAGDGVVGHLDEVNRRNDLRGG